MNDQQRIAAIRERVEKATAGPWWYLEPCSGPLGTSFNVVNGDADDRVCECHANETSPAGNADFIASARTDIPWLLDQLAARDAEIERIKQERNNEARRQGDFVEMLDDAGAKLWGFLEDVDASTFQSGEAAGELPRLVEAAIAEIERLMQCLNAANEFASNSVTHWMNVWGKQKVDADLLREHNERLIKGADSAAKIHPSYGPCDGLLEDGGCTECRRVYDQLRQQVAGLEATVDKLPKTADGVPVVPGMELWQVPGLIAGAKRPPRKCMPVIVDGEMLGEVDEYSFTYMAGDCYSTAIAAAEAAKGE